MNELVINEIEIENMIYEIRGKQVMLDSDLAKLYNCANGTKTINLAVKRHINRFPERYMFQLNEKEYNDLRFQIETTNMSRTLPYAFTEQGVAMLSAILRTKIAEEISIKIIDAFVAMRKYISTNLIDSNTMLINHENRISLLEETFSSFKEKTNHIFFEGQIYDAYSLLIDILSKANNEIIIIDNYAGKELFDILKDIKCNIKIISKNINTDLINKYNKQYNNIEIITSDKFHDRFIIIDKETLYHCGSSFKDLGKKCFAISKMNEKDLINELLKEIKKVLS